MDSALKEKEAVDQMSERYKKVKAICPPRDHVIMKSEIKICHAIHTKYEHTGNMHISDTSLA